MKRQTRVPSMAKISFKNLKHVAREPGERITDAEVQEIADMTEWASSLSRMWTSTLTIVLMFCAVMLQRMQPVVT